MKHKIPDHIIERAEACEKILELKEIDYKKFGIAECYAERLEFHDNFNKDIKVSIQVNEDGSVYFFADGRKNNWVVSEDETYKWMFLKEFHQDLFSASILLEEKYDEKNSRYIHLRYNLPATREKLMDIFSFTHLVFSGYEDFIDDVRDFCWEYNQLEAPKEEKEDE